MFAISSFFEIALIINISLCLLMIEISILKSKLSNIKAKSFLFLNAIKLKINMIMSLLNVYELIIMINIKILMLTFIITIKTSRENLLILRISNKIRLSNDSIKRFLTLLLFWPSLKSYIRYISIVSRFQNGCSCKIVLQSFCNRQSSRYDGFLFENLI